MFKKRTFIPFLLTFFISIPIANAASIKWTLNDAIFNDGGTATGSFVVNYISTSNLTVSDVDITVSAGTIVTSSSTYTAKRRFTWWATSGIFAELVAAKNNNYDPSLSKYVSPEWFQIYFGWPGLSADSKKLNIELKQYLYLGGSTSYTATPSSGQSLEDDFDSSSTSEVFERYLISGYVTGNNISAVPIPAAGFMFIPALLGFIGLRRKTKSSVV